jgi:hypothetical protein
MKYYILLDNEKFARQIIPEFEDVFPNVSIEKRYSQDFLSKCLVADSEKSIPKINQKYIFETNTFENVAIEAPTINIEDEKRALQSRLAQSETSLLPLIEDMFVYLESVGYKPKKEHEDIVLQRMKLKSDLESME